MRPEIGKYYRNRNGNIVGPLKPNIEGSENFYPFVSGEDDIHVSYTNDGHEFLTSESNYDLVEEVKMGKFTFAWLAPEQDVWLLSSNYFATYQEAYDAAMKWLKINKENNFPCLVQVRCPIEDGKEL